MAVKYRCPGCDTLRHIECRGERRHETRGTDMWWIIETHKHPDRQEICEGSGKKV